MCNMQHVLTFQVAVGWSAGAVLSFCAGQKGDMHAADCQIGAKQAGMSA
jgi:hypothetical protein